MNPEFASMSDDQIRVMAKELRSDAKSLVNHNRGEAMTLFRLFRRCLRELNYRDLARRIPVYQTN